jgi:hypothetical protein
MLTCLLTLLKLTELQLRRAVDQGESALKHENTRKKELLAGVFLYGVLLYLTDTPRPLFWPPAV